jgi:hypothetical protein
LIANVLNKDNEGYSKIKQLFKENVKAVLSENISIALAVIIQKLKSDHQMVNLIYNMPAAANDKASSDTCLSLFQFTFTTC